MNNTMKATLCGLALVFMLSACKDKPEETLTNTNNMQLTELVTNINEAHIAVLKAAQQGKYIQSAEGTYHYDPKTMDLFAPNDEVAKKLATDIIKAMEQNPGIDMEASGEFTYGETGGLISYTVSDEEGMRVTGYSAPDQGMAFD